jgi:Icc protein
MIVAQISDTHIAVDLPDSEIRKSDLERTIADINSLEPLPDAIVHTGDITQHGAPEEYRIVEEAISRARMPFFLVPGNKDNKSNLRAAFSAYGFFPAEGKFLQYAVEEFPIRLLVVDTVTPGINKGDYCEERVRRLIELTDADKTKPIAAFTHHPPFVVLVGPDALHYKDLIALSRLDGALQRSNRVTGIFSGHVHRSTRGYVGNIPASIVQCIATPLRKGEYPEQMKSRPVYHLHEFDADGNFVTQTRIVASSFANAA